jgi:hypothetical protein
MESDCTNTICDAIDEGGVQLFGAYGTIEVVLVISVQNRRERDVMQIQ